MRLTGVIWTCPRCNQEYEPFCDDGYSDEVLLWNWCPHCETKNNIWIRFKRPHEKIKHGIKYEETKEYKEMQNERHCFPNPTNTRRCRPG
jgi:hypothetical protein